jgi:peptide/nickel transport system permease protein
VVRPVGLVTFLLRRTAAGASVLLGVTALTFLLSHLVPGDPVVLWLGKTAETQPQLAAIYVKLYHLHDPLYLQFFYYVNGLLHLQLGFSPSRAEPVSQAITATLPITLQLVFVSMIITTVLGILSGILSAMYAGRIPDKISRAFYLFGTASPAFLIPLLLVLIFTFLIPVLPNGGLINESIPLPPPITGFPILDALIEGDWSAFQSLAQHLLLPSLALSLASYGIVTRVLRSSILEIMGSNFVRAARARGLPERRIMFGYAFKNSLVEVITLLSLIFNFTLTGDVFVEQIFSYPGLGRYALQTALSFDYPGLFGTTLVYALFVVGVNLTADILYAVVDPRIRLF